MTFVDDRRKLDSRYPIAGFEMTFANSLERASSHLTTAEDHAQRKRNR